MRRALRRARRALGALGGPDEVRIEAAPEDLARLPRAGALLLVSRRRLRAAERRAIHEIVRGARSAGERVALVSAAQAARGRCERRGLLVAALHLEPARRSDARARRLLIGTPLAAATGSTPERDGRARLELALAALSARASRCAPPERGSAGAAARTPAPVPVVARGDAAWLAREIGTLAPARILVPSERFAVAALRAEEAPALLHEIGRLRERTFRAAGEGTGRAIDLDAFDRDYLHLVAWDRAAGALAGAYRLGETATVLPARGAGGLYTSTLFDFRPGFFEALGPAVELGRSFVSAEHQRRGVVLVLLWKAIARFVATRSAAGIAPVLFGAVSVSNRYGAFSRALLASALAPRAEDAALAARVRPRRPAPLLARPLAVAARSLRDTAALSALVSDAEPDGAPIPVLVREYGKLGGRVLAWSVDPGFGDTQDGLVVVDLARSAPRLLEFYLGKAEAAAFRARCSGVSAW
jgi:putative hemolysin